MKIKIKNQLTPTLCRTAEHFMSIFVVKKVGDLLTTRQCLGSFVGLVSFFVRHAGEDECVPETTAT